MEKDYKYEVITIIAPLVDRDLTVRVNEEVRRIRGWKGKPQHVRVVSLSKAVCDGDWYVLTIEYTAKES